MRPTFVACAFLLGLCAGCPSSTTGTDVPGSLDAATDVPSPLDVPAALDAPREDGGTLADAPTTFDAPPGDCAMNSECVIRAASCCGRCGAATADDFVALHVDDVSAYNGLVCEGGTIGCPECASPDDPYLVAWCDGGSCAGVNLAEDPITECDAPSDCMLAARRCCDCGVLGVADTIAYNPANGSPTDRICDADVTCPPCVPTFDSLTAGCTAAGRCVVYGPD